MDKPVIDIQGITKRFQSKPILKNFSLSVLPGSVFGLLGKNGAGKTTLIKSILGLLRVSSGHISVLSDNPWAFREETKERLGYVPQSDRVYPWLTVQQLLDYTASFYRRWNHGLIKRLADDWNVNRKETFGLLSEGEAQKVSILLALGHEPELLIFDEPVASLDPAARRQFLRMILEILEERACTVFFSTHITSDLERVADHVAVLKEGYIDFCGELDQLKEEVKRLRVHSSRPVRKEDLPAGVLHYETAGSAVIMSIRGFGDEVRGHMERTFGTQVQVEDLNLEDIFLELNR